MIIHIAVVISKFCSIIMLPIDELLLWQTMLFHLQVSTTWATIQWVSFAQENFCNTKFSQVFNLQISPFTNNIRMKIFDAQHTDFHTLTARASMNNIQELSCRSTRKSLQRNTFRVGIDLLTDVSSSGRQCDGTCLVAWARLTSEVVALTPTLPFSCGSGSGLRD